MSNLQPREGWCLTEGLQNFGTKLVKLISEFYPLAFSSRFTFRESTISPSAADVSYKSCIHTSQANLASLAYRRTMNSQAEVADGSVHRFVHDLPPRILPTLWLRRRVRKRH
jgi:hypothetical protein